MRRWRANRGSHVAGRCISPGHTDTLCESYMRRFLFLAVLGLTLGTQLRRRSGIADDSV